ncbi:MAG: ASCH domain-containing protein [Chloroflexota bacterium]
MENSEAITAFWQRYLDSLPAEAPEREQGYVAEAFGDNPALSDELGALVLAGRKTATCSVLWEWEAQGEALPQPGFKTVLLDGQGRPLCVIETTAVEVKAFDQVEADFAYAEGEGERSLAYWRQAHWRAFGRSLALIGKAPQEAMPLVCERFQVVFRG